MIPAIKLLLEIHLNQCLVVLCGYLLAKQVLRTTSSPKTEVDGASAYILGFLWFAIVGAIALISPVPTRTIIGLTAGLVGVLLYKNRLTILEGWQAYRSLCLFPFLVFLAPAIFFLSHFTATEITKGIDPWLLVDRTLSYRVPDHYLQWLVSENFFKGVPIETNFNPKGNSMWSAGDRPVLIGLLDATFSQVTNASSITMYYLRVIFISSLVLPILNTLLREEFKIQKPSIRFLSLLTISISPFFLVNIFFTWPKMAGLSFGLMGFSLFAKAMRLQRARYAVVGGIGIALGLISHTAAMFCLIATMLYAASVWLLSYRITMPLKQLAGLVIALLLPLLVVTQVHGQLLARVTNQTNLLARVQLCQGGSYAFLTPVESVLESCKKYYERKGFAGVIADRQESLQRAFDFSPLTYTQGVMNAITHPEGLGEYLRSLNTPLLLVVPMSIGHLTPFFAAVLLVAYVVSIGRHKILPFTQVSLLLPIGLILLTLFSCMLGAYTEMSSHVVPFVAPVFIQLGILLELYRLWNPAYFMYVAVSISVSVGVILARLNVL